MYIALGLVGFTALIFGAWRFASRRHSLPCPVWLRSLVELDNPLTKTNRASVILENLDLQPGGVLSVTEIIFDPHFQRQRTVVQLAETVGFREKALFGNRFAYTLLLEKPRER